MKYIHDKVTRNTKNAESMKGSIIMTASMEIRMFEAKAAVSSEMMMQVMSNM